MRIQSGTFPVDSHEFVKIIEPKDILIDFENLSPTEMVKEVTEKCYPLLEESELTSAQIKKRLPLFGATLILLPNDYALYSIKVSHAVGDGVTFFMLLKQLSLLMSGLPAPAIDWDHPKKPLHELYPPELSAKDVELMYGAPFMVGAAKNILTQPARKVEVLLLDKEKVHKKKQELRKNLECPNLSSNDVITAALCQGGLSSDVIVFTEDARGEKSGIGHNAAGNFLVEIPIPREVGSQPDKLREIVAQLQSLQEMGLQELSLKPFIHGRVGRITSLATIPAGLVYKDTKQVCAIPYLSFLERIPLDTALIFRFNKQYWGVLHNFADFEAPELLKELVEETEESSDQSGKENRPEMIETPPQTDSIPFYAKLECTK